VLRLLAGGHTNKEIADLFTEVVGRPVPYLEISDEQWASAATEAGINAAAVEHLSHLWRFLRTRPPEYQAWYQTTDTFERLTGQTPQSLAQFLHEDKDLLAGVAAAPNPPLSPGQAPMSSVTPTRRCSDCCYRGSRE
jgi:hypothetical protein